MSRKVVLTILCLLVLGVLTACALSNCGPKSPRVGDYTIGTVVELRDNGKTVVFEDLDHQGHQMILDSDYVLAVGDHVRYEYRSRQGYVVSHPVSLEEYNKFRVLWGWPPEEK